MGSVLEIDDDSLRAVFDPEKDSVLNLLNPIKDGSEHTRQFELLLGDKYMLEYELAVIGYLRHWSIVSPETYQFNNTCSICKHFGLNGKTGGRSMLINLYCNTVPRMVYSVVHAAVICLLSVEGLGIEQLSPRDVAFHFFQNNCVIEGNRYEAQLLRKMQNDYLFCINPFFEMFTDITARRVAVIDRNSTGGCPCNKTKDDINEIILTSKNESSGYTDKDGFLIEDGCMISHNLTKAVS